MKYYKDDCKIYISGDNPKEISLDKALEEIESFTTEEGNFIGFVNENEETIQFLRFDDGWMVDIPILLNGEYLDSKRASLSHEKVKEIATLFFNKEPLPKIIEISKARVVKKGEDVDESYNK